jgi:hypothetical protein
VVAKDWAARIGLSGEGMSGAEGQGGQANAVSIVRGEAGAEAGATSIWHSESSSLGLSAYLFCPTLNVNQLPGDNDSSSSSVLSDDTFAQEIREFIQSPKERSEGFK